MVLLGTLCTFEEKPIDVVHGSCVVLSWTSSGFVLMQRHFVLHHLVAFVRSSDVNFDCGVDASTVACRRDRHARVVVFLEGPVVIAPALLPPSPILVVEVQGATSHLKIEEGLRVHCSLRSLVVSDCRSTVRELCRAIAY